MITRKSAKHIEIITPQGFCLFLNKSKRVCAEHIAEKRSQNSNILKPPSETHTENLNLRQGFHPTEWFYTL